MGTATVSRRGQLKRACFLFIPAVIALIFQFAQFGWAATDPGPRSVSLRNALNSLAARAGFELDLRVAGGESAAPVGATLPAPIAVRRLLDADAYSYVLEFEPSRPGDNTRRLAKVTVLAVGDAAVAPARAVSSGPQETDAADTALRREAIDTLEQAMREEANSTARDAAAEALAELKEAVGR